MIAAALLHYPECMTQTLTAPAYEIPGRAKGVPEIPVFATHEETRKHRKERLAGAFRLFARFGFSEGVAGHITARDPEHTGRFWVNPFGMHFGQIRGPTCCWSTTRAR